MAEHFLISLDHEHPNPPDDKCIDLKTISYSNRVLLSVTPSSLSSALSFLDTHFAAFSIFCDVTALPDLGDVVSVLDHGATKVFVSLHQMNEIIHQSILEDVSRLVVSFDESFCRGDPAVVVVNIQAEIRKIPGNVPLDLHLREIRDWKLLDLMHDYEGRPEGYPHRFVTMAQNDQVSYAKAVEGGHWPIVPRSSVTNRPHKYPMLIPSHHLITAAIHTDRPDGLYTTIVMDERDMCLGLVYSSKESIRMALQSGAGVYYSRSRKDIWIKGATSGDTQELISIGWDCDGDALKFKVRQKGTGVFPLFKAYGEFWLSCSRLLPLADVNVLRSIFRTFSTAKDTSKSQSISTSCFLHE